MTKTYYVIWCPEEGPPKVRHAHMTSAENEAARLAKKNPEKTFIILRALCEYRAEVSVQNRWLPV